MKVLVDKNDDYNAYIYNNNKNVGDAQQEKRKVHVISSDMIPFHQEGEAVVGVIFHQSEINVKVLHQCITWNTNNVDVRNTSTFKYNCAYTTNQIRLQKSEYYVHFEYFLKTQQ